MTTVFKGREITDAVIAALTAASLHVGDGDKPAGTGWQGNPGASNFVPYVIVYPLLGGTVDGSLDDPQADAWPAYQLTSTGGTRAQCELIADRARAVMLTAIAGQTIDGRRIGFVLIDALPGATREDDNQPSLYFAPERFRLQTSPA